MCRPGCLVDERIRDFLFLIVQGTPVHDAWRRCGWRSRASFYRAALRHDARDVLRILRREAYDGRFAQ